MVDELIPESKEAVEAAAAHAELVEKARYAQLESAQKFNDGRIESLFKSALNDVFGEGKNSGRYIDVSRIPLICKSIIDMNDKINDINDSIKWGVRVVIGAVILAVLGLIFVH